MGARARRPLRLPLLLLLLLVPPPPPRALAFRPLLRLRELSTVLSLSHSLLSRIAASRDARGDAAAASRARRIAAHLSLLGGGGGGGGAWSLGWDYLRNYAFSGGGGPLSAPAAAAASRLLAAISEASRLDTGAEAAQWLLRNYAELRAAAESLLRSLLSNFSKEGPLRDVVFDLKREMDEGELLKDCLEIGAKDLQGLLVIAKDLLFAYSAPSSPRDGEL